MGTTNFPIAVGVTVTGANDADKLAAAMSKIATSIDAAGQKAVDHRTSFEKFGESVKGGIKDPLGAAGDAAESFLKSIGPVGVGVGVAAAGFAALGTAAFASMKSLGELGTQIENISIRTGLSTKEVGQFSFAAKAAGSDISAFETAMRMLSKGLSDNSEDGKKARQALADIGVEARNIDGSLRPTSDIFMQISERMVGMSNMADRNTLALKLFGRSGLELVPTLMSLSENLKIAKEHGFGMDEAEVAKLKKYHEQLVLIETEWDVLARKFKEPLAAVLSVTLKWLASGDATLGNGLPGRYGATQALLGQASPRGFMGPIPSESQLARAGILTEADISRNDAMVSGVHSDDSLQSQLAKAKAALTKSQGELLSGVLPSVNQPTFDKIAEEKALIASLEARIQKTKELAEAEKEEQKQAEARMALAAKGRDIIGRYLTSGARAAGSDMRISGLPGLPDYMTPGIFSNFNNGGPDPVKSLPITDMSALGYNSSQFTHGLNSENKTLADQIHEGEKALKADDEIRAKLSKEALANEQKIADLRQQAEDRYVESVQRGFDALISGGGGGISSFFKSQAVGLERTVVGNVARMTYSGIQGKASLTDDPNSLLGKLLKGTPFGADPLKVSTDANTLATNANTAALRALSLSKTGGGGGLPSGNFGGGYQGGGIFSFGEGSGADASGASGMDSYLLSGADAYLGKPETIGSGGMSLGKGLGIAGAAAGGAFGVYSGIHQGGVKGAVTAAGSLAGAAGGIMMAAGVSGPAAPILMGIGMALGMVTSLFGDPKANRQKDITDALEKAQYIAPQSINRTMDTGGNYFDYDRRGNVRTSPFSSIPELQQGYWDSSNKTMVPGRQTSPYGGQVYVTINAFDPSSFRDYVSRNREAVGDAMYQLVQNDNHPVVGALQKRL